MKIPKGVSKAIKTEGVAVVARKYGVAYMTVRRWAWKLGVRSKRVRKGGAYLIPIPKGAAKMLLKEGLTYTAKMFNVAYGTAQGWALKLGVTPPRSSSRYAQRKREAFLERAAKVALLVVKNQSTVITAGELGISHQRVQQIITKSGLATRGWILANGKHPSGHRNSVKQC